MESHNSTSLKPLHHSKLFFSRICMSEGVRIFPNPLLKFSLPRIICPTSIFDWNGSGVLSFFFGAPMPSLVQGGGWGGGLWWHGWGLEGWLLKAESHSRDFSNFYWCHLLPSDPGGIETPSLQEYRPLWLETRKRVAVISRPISSGQKCPLLIWGSPSNTNGGWGLC